MINCGGTVDVVDFLDPPDDVVIFVADSHRPTDVCNIYSDGQVRLLMKQDEDEGKMDDSQMALFSTSATPCWIFNGLNVKIGHFLHWKPLLVEHLHVTLDT